MSGIIGSDLNSINMHSLKETNTFNFGSAVLHISHSKNIKLLLFLSLRHYLSIVLKHNWKQSFGRSRSDNWAFISMLLSQIRKSSTMIQMKMSYDDQIDSVVNAFRRRVQLRKLGITSMIRIEHVNTNIKHNGSICKSYTNTRTAYFLACSQTKYFNRCARTFNIH